MECPQVVSIIVASWDDELVLVRVVCVSFGLSCLEVLHFCCVNGIFGVSLSCRTIGIFACDCWLRKNDADAS